MMIGDGLNDAGALRQSNAGIAITEDTNNFTPASDAILEAAQLPKLPLFIRLCIANKHIVLASFVLSILYNIAGIYFAVQGVLSPLIAAILMRRQQPEHRIAHFRLYQPVSNPLEVMRIQGLPGRFPPHLIKIILSAKCNHFPRIRVQVLFVHQSESMSVIIILIIASVSIAAFFLAAFCWSVKDKQYDDEFSPPAHALRR